MKAQVVKQTKYCPPLAALVVSWILFSGEAVLEPYNGMIPLESGCSCWNRVSKHVRYGHITLAEPSFTCHYGHKRVMASWTGCSSITLMHAIPSVVVHIIHVLTATDRASLPSISGGVIYLPILYCISNQQQPCVSKEFACISHPFWD